MHIFVVGFFVCLPLHVKNSSCVIGTASDRVLRRNQIETSVSYKNDTTETNITKFNLKQMIIVKLMRTS